MSATIWTPGALGDVLSSKLVKEIALSDMVTPLSAANGLGYFRVYAPFRVLAFYASLFAVSSSGLVTVDINVDTVSILTTKLSIDANEKDNTNAATPYVLVGSPTPSFYDFSIGQEVSFDLDAGGTGAKGLILYMVGFDL
jgi:hypothetical protein